MEDNPELKMVKSMLRSVLISCKEGVLAATLQKEYKEMVGDYLPYKKFGCSSLEEFIMSVPDVVRVSRKGPDFICHAVADQSTEHIQKLVSKQRSKKLKRPVRRPRGGGGGGFLSRGRGRPRNYPPRYVQPPGIEMSPPMRYGMPRVMLANKQLTPFTIHVGNASSGSRTVKVGSNRLLTKAMHEANTGRSSQSSRYEAPERFETPPRFRKKQVVQETPQSQTFHQATSKRPQAKQEFPKIPGGDKYKTELESYLREFNYPMNFDTVAAYGGYVSSITVNKVTYGSEDVYATAQEAEQAAAQTAISRIDRKKSQVSSLPEIDWDDTYSSVPTAAAIPPEKLRVIKTRIKEYLLNKKQGVWGAVIPHQYKDKYNEEAPANLLDMIKTWKDIAKVELVPNTNRDIVYPVEGSENKDLVIPYEPLIKSCDEKVVVYMTYIHNPGYFCVQREDSCIDDISEQLQTYCKSMSSPDPSLFEKNQYCAGVYSGDGCWTRAQILKIRDDRTVQLLFVDYGNVEVVKMESLRWLSPELARYPVQSVTCSLYGVEPLEGEADWNSRSLTELSNLVKEVALEAIPKSLFDNVVEVDMYVKSDPSESISDKLARVGVVKSIREKIETLEKMDPEPITLPEDKLWDVYITFINASTNCVMVRLVGDDYSDKLEVFQAKLQQAFRSSSSEAPIIEGMTYVAFDDALYHRVKVVSKEGRKVSCYFLDHGDTDELIPDQLEPLDPAVNRLLPYQAVEVSLYGLEDVATNITALERMCELALTRTCVAEVMDREGVPSVILYDTSSDVDININEKILEAIQADGGGIDSSGSASSTPQRILSPVPSEQQISTKLSDLSPVSVQGGGDLSNSNNLMTESNGEAILDLQNISLEEKSTVKQISTNLLEKPKLTTPYIPPAPSESPPRLECTDVRISPQRTPEVSEICDKKDSPDQRYGTALAKSDLLTNIRDEVIKPKSVKKVQYTSRTLPPFSIPLVGEYLELHCNVIHDPSNFRCLPYEELNNLTQLYMEMGDYYCDKPPVMMTKDDIKLGELYAGLLDALWYRIRVTQFVSKDLLSVYLVDYGEHSVMELTEIQPLYNQFCRLPLMAITATLGGIEPTGGSWSEAAKYKFIELAQERDLIGLILDHDKSAGKVSVRLIDTTSEQDLCIDEVLISMGYAKVVEK